METQEFLDVQQEDQELHQVLMGHQLLEVVVDLVVVMDQLLAERQEVVEQVVHSQQEMEQQEQQTLAVAAVVELEVDHQVVMVQLVVVELLLLGINFNS